ncbi:hypothetical protein E2C01_091693 [Portunus trituberculatus]|uniref:Uncharacterized protein n=1 Tax=Portunus trituberculatus TaxID=210409 RepID=A0A5B7JPB2_PORTR|nr:hypothetical protein [Portunus trituberculatus]
MWRGMWCGPERGDVCWGGVLGPGVVSDVAGSGRGRGCGKVGACWIQERHTWATIQV